MRLLFIFILMCASFWAAAQMDTAYFWNDMRWEKDSANKYRLQNKNSDSVQFIRELKSYDINFNL